MDIVIYTNDDVLEHTEDGDKEYSNYYWHMSRCPKDFKVGDKVYFATKGWVQGYFVASEFNPGDLETIVWDKNTWTDLEEGMPAKSFRGFRYRWW